MSSSNVSTRFELKETAGQCATLVLSQFPAIVSTRSSLAELERKVGRHALEINFFDGWSHWR
jgi:hypothetical protein